MQLAENNLGKTEVVLFGKEDVSKVFPVDGFYLLT